MSRENVRAIVEDAGEFHEAPSEVRSTKKPRLLIENTNPDKTVAALRDKLAAAGGLYDRGVPVRLASTRCNEVRSPK